MNSKVPQELLDLYAQLVKNTEDPAQQAQHLQNFLEDARVIAQAIQAVIDQARSRAGQ